MYHNVTAKEPPCHQNLTTRSHYVTTLLTLYYLHVTTMVLAYCHYITTMLPPYYQHVTSMLHCYHHIPHLYPGQCETSEGHHHVTTMLPPYYHHSTTMLPQFYYTVTTTCPTCILASVRVVSGTTMCPRDKGWEITSLVETLIQ